MFRLFRKISRLTVVSIVLATVFLFSSYINFCSDGALTQATNVVINKGASLGQISTKLKEAKVIDNKLSFKFWVKLYGAVGHMKAGEYNFPAYSSPKEVMNIILSGKTVIHHLTIPEGLTVQQIFERIYNEPLLEGDITIPVKEGWLLPETYAFSLGDDRNKLVERMQRSMIDFIDSEWDNRTSNLPFKTKEDAINLAAIVEKETSLTIERPRVAGVYINRLRKRMRLQADPTVIYVVSGRYGYMDRPLSRKDLKNPSPYNTYMHYGLPPTPIANPGAESIRAVLNPMNTKDIFFVADGTGGHLFAEKLVDHNANVAKWRAFLRKSKNK